jgi:hypothetical protein
MKQGRGELTDRVQEKAVEMFGREITLRELRLMPYIQHTMMNNQRIEPAKLNGEERDVLQQWREAGHIEGGASGLRPQRSGGCCERSERRRPHSKPRGATR